MPARFKLGLRPPQEAIDFFRQKGYRIGFDHRDVWQQEHQAAFTVAKAMQLDLLQDIRAQVDAALQNGTTLAEFQAALKPNLVKRGWWGKAMMADPATGEVKQVQLGSPRRLKVIYDTNLRTSHGEGQWTRIQGTKETFPYLQYDHTPSQHERKEHAAWDGLVFHVDDPWVAAHFPVKEWGCKCRMIQLSRRQIERRGLSVAKAPPETYTRHTNKRTGETQLVPAGVAPEFNYAPGGRRASLVNYMASRIERLAPDLQPAAVRALNADGFAEWAQHAAGDWPIAVMLEKHAKGMALQSSLVRLSAATAAKQAKQHPELAAAEYGHIQDAVERGRAIQESEREMIFVLEDEGYVSVVKATKTGKAAFLTSFRRLSADKAKREREIQRLLQKGDEK